MGSISDFDIDEYFGKRVHYPRDMLPKRLNDDDFLIINTDLHTGKGLHYVALKNENGYTMYIDSFGAAPLPEALKLARTKKDEIIYNIYRIQDFNSNFCGLFCIDFIENVK